jgi:phage gp16-like protein
MTYKLRTDDLAKIHIAKKDLGLDDETYRAVLWTCARVHSSKDLDHAGRAAVLDHFKARGWKAKPPVKAKQKAKLSDEPQHKMIRGLWLELHANGTVIDPSEKAIARFIKNQTKVDRMEWLSVNQASQIIERLKSWLNRSTNKVAS